MPDTRGWWQWQTCKGKAETKDVLQSEVSGPFLSEIHPSGIFLLAGNTWTSIATCSSSDTDTPTSKDGSPTWQANEDFLMAWNCLRAEEGLAYGCRHKSNLTDVPTLWFLKLAYIFPEQIFTARRYVVLDKPYSASSWIIYIKPYQQFK